MIALPINRALRKLMLIGVASPIRTISMRCATNTGPDMARQPNRMGLG